MKKWGNRSIQIGLAYTMFVMAIGAYFNYTIPYDPSPTSPIPFIQILIWVMCYIPLIGYALFAKWEVKEMGFTVTPACLGASLFFITLCSLVTLNLTSSWMGYLANAFARTGEELFFRGFLMGLLMMIFTTKRRPWLWAAILSSILFMIIHTQTFQPAYSATLGKGPVAFDIAQKLFTDFSIGFGLALIRYWTKSILPGSIAHSAINGGSLTFPFVLLIHAGILLWAVLRKENVISGFPALSTKKA